MPLLIMIILINVFPNQTAYSTHFNALIFWNVGQGQWITYTQANNCLHFDMGGEYFPLRKIENICGSKNNLIYLSHWDWDHIGGIKRIQKKKEWLQKFCLAQTPSYETKSSKMLLFKNIRTCEKIPSKSSNIFPNTLALVKQLALNKDMIRKSKNKKRIVGNDFSHIFIVDDFLIPGDSPHQTITASLQNKNSQIKILSLSHHGSKTGTSIELLNKLPQLKMTIASARQARYKHPHPEVIWALQQRKIPLLRTEDWGNIFILRH